MKLRRLAIQRLPGIDRPFELEELRDGLNIIVGPNGIGKSRLCAAVRALLWHARGIKDGGLAASAVFEHQGAPWRVERDGSRHGWQRDGLDVEQPGLPGERLEGCFFLGLRDLLDDSDSAGRDLAGEIRRQMAGGFDLDAVRRRFKESVPTRVGTKESKALGTAEKDIRTAERSQVDVERQEQELESLKTRAAKAASALRRLAHYDTALSLQKMRRDHAQRQAELTELPAALANLDGKETVRLDKLEEDLGQKRRDRAEADNALSESHETARGTHLREPIDPTALATWRARAENLADLERRLEVARENAAAAREAASACRKALGSHTASDADAPLAIDDDFDLFAFLRESHQLVTERVVLQERLRLLTARQFSDESARRLALLKRGVGSLRAWLRAPDPALQAPRVTRGPARAFYMVAGVVLVALGLGLQPIEQAQPIGLVMVGLGLGLAAAGLLSRVGGGRRDGTDWRSIEAQKFPDTLAPPGTWSANAVEDRLRQLEDELAKLDADEKRSRDRAVERAPLEESIRGVEQRDADLEARRRALADRLGLDARRPDVEMVDLAHALDASRAADAEARGAVAALDEIAELRRTLLEEITVLLHGLDEAAPTDAAAARAGVDSLDARDRMLRGAQADAVREEKTRGRLDREIAQLESDRAEIFRVAGVEASDRVQLTRMLGALPRYGALRSECADLASSVRRERSNLDAAGESALAQLDAARLSEERAALQEKSEQSERLNNQIGAIRERVRSAREGHVLEDAIAKKSAALRELRDRRDDALAALAGEFLIDAVRREHETNQRPRVLERARHHFGTFTHQRYELQVSPTDGGSFVAVDMKEGGAGLSPDKLSDGTRAQLILAARLAFAEEAEQGAELPLFLDEALDHSDPERFHAIARSLARMVLDAGRQVFYLGNDPTDVDRFRSAFAEEGCEQLQTIDLGAIRGQAASVGGPAALHVAPLAVVPSPDGQNAESYGAAIGVARLDPRRDAVSQHLYYVLWEDLSLLYELLQARIETVGQCRNLLTGRSALAKGIAARSAAGVQLEARIALLESFCLAWREGRGRKVGRLEIEESREVSDIYLQAVVDVATELDGDAARLLAALRERSDPRLSGYRSKSTEDLERFFAEHGYIDDKPILNEHEIVERAIGTPAANDLSPRIAAELVHQWWGLSEHARIT